MKTRPIAHAVLALLAVVPLGCGGGGSSTPMAPSPPPSGGAPPAATIRLTAGGAQPREVVVPVGSQVAFVNESGVQRNVSSDPHPVHTDCPAINQVGVLAPGQTRQTGTFTGARRCGFHDHDDPDNAAAQGTIVVQ